MSYIHPSTLAREAIHAVEALRDRVAHLNAEPVQHDFPKELESLNKALRCLEHARRSLNDIYGSGE